MSSNEADQFRSEVFRDEALELLTELETSLLELEGSPQDQELVGRIFRALHTIKGSGAMYGFEALSRFTHEFETAFDLVRSGKMGAGAEFVRLALRARDQILALLREHTGEGTADEAEIRAILRELTRLTARTAERGQRSAEDPAQGAGQVGTGQVGVGQAEAGGLVEQYRILFRPQPELLLHGANPLLLLRELQELGRTEVRLLCEEVPPFAELDPEKCYLAWDIQLWTGKGADAVRDVFIFVEDQCELRIEKVKEEAPEPIAESAPVAASTAVAAPAAGPRAVQSLSTSSIRVGAEKLDRLVNLVGELVTVQARLSGYAALREDAEMQFLAEEVERLTAELRDNSMSLRMVPLKSAFERLRRLVHDLARELGKDVEFRTSGEETELDKSMIEQLHDPLVHLIRNSLDHGMETPEQRRAAGKAAQGVVQMTATQSGTSVLIRVSDDGRGLDRAAIRARAVKQGLLGADEVRSDNEICQFILAAGFTTAREVTSISGRGVGMDVVRSGVEGMRGSLEVESEEGHGTTMTLRLPLTLAIIEGLLVRVAGSLFVLPLTSVQECVDLAGAACGGRREMAVVRGELVPYLRLRTLFGINGEAPDMEQILVTQTERGRLGLVVDQVLGNHHTVIKSLGRFYRRVQEMSGATILGDGTVALILDVERLAQLHAVGTAMRKAG